MLGPLEDNGGPTFTHALVVGSPAIDAGKDLSGTGKDQRGRTRPYDDASKNAAPGDKSDIGAFELISQVVTNSDDSGAGSLRQAIADAGTADAIYFDSSLNGQAITLTSGELLVDESLIIAGPGADKLAVDGNANGRVFHIGSGTNVTISGLTIRNGVASGGFPDDAGGGIYNDHGTLTLTDSAVSGNSGVYGAGFYSNGEGSGSATLTLTNSTVSGNTADELAGGIYNDGFQGDATLTVTNSTVSGNAAHNSQDLGGGGIYNGGSQSGSVATLTLTNSTLSGNSAVSGGGIYNDHATLIIGNTILNTGASGENIFNEFGTITSEGHNLSSDGGVNNMTGSSGALNGPGDQTDTDPKLGPLADNGGATLTHALLLGSPALDAGDNTLASNAGLTTDQRGTGFGRVLDAGSDADTTQTVDIGAFEADPSIEDITDKSTDEDTPLSFTFNVGDSATPFASITAISSNTTLVPNGNLSVGNDTPSTRTLSITPAANQNGTATITVTATKTINGKTLSMSDTFVLIVSAVNDAPVADAQSVTTNEDAAKAITLTGSDVEGDALTFSVVTHPAHGTLSGTAPNLTYTPNVNYSGPDSFTFKANDGHADPNTATVSIDVVALPRVEFNSASYDAQENAGIVTLTLTRSGDQTKAATVHVGTSDGSAHAGSDYIATSTDVTIPAGFAQEAFTVSIANDRAAETAEDFTVTLTSSASAKIGAQSSANVTIIDKDGPRPTVEFSPAAYRVKEKHRPVVLTLKRIGKQSTDATVHFVTSDGTAKAGSDYRARSGEVVFAAGGSDTQTISIPIIDNRKHEPNQTFTVTLTGTPTARVAAPKTATVTIRDSD